MTSYTDTELDAMFRDWWRQSFPQAPPGPHAIRSHVSWGRYLLDQQQQQQQREQQR